MDFQTERFEMRIRHMVEIVAVTAVSVVVGIVAGCFTVKTMTSVTTPLSHDGMISCSFDDGSQVDGIYPCFHDDGNGDAYISFGADGPTYYIPR